MTGILQAAVRAHRAGDLDQAESAYREFLSTHPGHAEAARLLGTLLAQAQRFEEALFWLEQAVAHAPQPGDLSNLGELYRRLGRAAEAAAVLRQAVSLAPELPEAHFNLGNALKAVGDFDSAIASYRQAIALRPDYGKAHFNLANTLRESGQYPAAIAGYRRLLSLHPDWADAHVNLSAALLETGDTAAALPHLEEARRLDPEDPELDASLGIAWYRHGSCQRAREWFARDLARHPDSWVRRFRLDTLIEPVPESVEAIDTMRQSLARTLAHYCQEPANLDLATLHASGCEPSAALLYHGRDQRPLREAFARVFAPAISPVELLPPEGSPHVGVVVTPRHEVVFGRCLGELLSRLSPELRLSLFCGRSSLPVLRHMVPRLAEACRILPERLDLAAECLRQARLDVVLYWECGTDSLNYFLPCFRPARVQCVCWGWPETSGHPQVADFLSAAELEPPGAASHYSENLVLLPALPTYYPPPPAPATRADRSLLGLPAGRRACFCPQNPRKIHPDFDQALLALLQADGEAEVLLLAEDQPGLRESLQRRLAGVLGDCMDRVSFLPRRSREEYLRVMSAADVLLDTFHYGGGANTVADAFACGVPVVTLPGTFQRGRWTAAVCRRAGLTELIAESPEDYVRRALALARDSAWRHELGSRMRRALAEGLLADPASVNAVEAYLRHRAADRLDHCPKGRGPM